MITSWDVPCSKQWIYFSPIVNEYLDDNCLVSDLSQDGIITSWDIPCSKQWIYFNPIVNEYLEDDCLVSDLSQDGIITSWDIPCSKQWIYYSPIVNEYLDDNCLVSECHWLITRWHNYLVRYSLFKVMNLLHSYYQWMSDCGQENNGL